MLADFSRLSTNIKGQILYSIRTPLKNGVRRQIWKKFELTQFVVNHGIK